MKKTEKGRLIGAGICVLAGVIIFICILMNQAKISEELRSYFYGFVFGIMTVGGYYIFRAVIMMKNPNEKKRLENIDNDERIKDIVNRSLSVVLTFTVLAEAIISIICAINGNMEVSKYLGIVIGIQMIVYGISYIILSKIM